MNDRHTIHALHNFCEFKHVMDGDHCVEISFHDEHNVFGGTIRRNAMKDQIVRMAASLPHLKKFSVRKCRLGRLPHMASKQIESLDLSCNDLTEVPSWVLRQPLKHLNLGANRLRSVPDLSHLPLESLKLHKNALAEPPRGPQCLKNLNVFLNPMPMPDLAVYPSLEVFTYGVTAADRLGRLPLGLRWLTVAVTKIEGLPDEVCDLPALEGLVLPKNRISRLPERIGQLKNLKSITLYSNQLQELPESFYELAPNKLNLANNPVNKERARNKFAGIDFLRT